MYRKISALVKSRYKTISLLILSLLIIPVLVLNSGEIFYKLNLSRQKQISIETIDTKGVLLKDIEKQVFIVRNKSELQSFITVLNQHNAVSEPPNDLIKRLSKINFSRSTLVGVFAGRKPSGGYHLNPIQLRETDNKVTVNVQEISPGKKCMLLFSISYPFSLFQISTTGVEIEVVTQEIMKDCG